MENEFCPVFAVNTNSEANINTEEVEQIMKMDWHERLNELQQDHS